MKIAIIAHSVFPISQPYKGGLEKFIHILATKLANKGIDVTLYCHSDSIEGPYKKIGFTNFEYHFNNDFRELNNDYLKLLSELRNNSDYDLFHNNSLNNDILSLSKNDTPMLTTIHVPPIDGFRQAVYRNFINKNSFTNIVSKSCLRSWKGFDYCKVIHNGIDVDKWEYNSPYREGAIWFGRICPEKGVERSIQAAVKAGLPLKIVGIVNDQDYFDYLNKKYKNKFEYLGLCNQKQLSKIISSSKVFIKAPLWEEPFGLVYLESLACGTPVATYKSNISRELLTVDVANITLNNINDLAMGASSLDRFSSQECRDYVRSNFSIDSCIDNYIKFYKDILKCTK